MIPENIHPENIQTVLCSLLADNLLLERLFFASVELAALALVVALLLRLARIRSPRVISLLWLLVLIKPIVSLAMGSPVPILLLGAAESEMTEIARASAPVAPALADGRLRVANEPPAAFGNYPPAEAPTPVPGHVLPMATADNRPVEDSIEAYIPSAIIAAWLAGVMFFLSRYLRGRLRLHGIVRAARAPNASLRACCRTIASELGLKRSPRLLVTEELDSPAMIGLLRPVILVPSWMAVEGDGAKLDWSLRHELTHCKWLDPAALLVRDLAAILFYFHPAAWWAAKRQTEAMELACDRALIKNDSDARNYAEQLYQILRSIRHSRQVAVAGGLFATRTQVGKRIAALLDGRIVSARRLTPLSVAGLLVVAIAALAVGGAFQDSSQADPDRDKVQRQGRVIRFPRDRLPADVYVREPRSWGGLQSAGSRWQRGWDLLGAASGTVRVPPDKDVRLNVYAGVLDLRALSALAPDDIQMIVFRDVASDANMVHVARLTGLKQLCFYRGLPGEAGCAQISRLKSLEALMTGSGGSLSDNRLRGLVTHLKGPKSFRHLRLLRTQLTDAGLAHLRELDSLESLSFSNDKMTGSGFAHLAKLPALKNLEFWSETIDDTALAHLAKSTSLKRLVPMSPRITDAGMAHLAGLKSLESLNLFGLRIGDAGVRHLSQLTSLKALNLDMTRVTDSGMAHLAKLTSLEQLTLPRGITDAGLVQLRDLTRMKSLSARFRYAGGGLEPLRHMHSLESLTLPNNITDEDLAILDGMPALKTLQFRSSLVTNQGMKHLASCRSLGYLALMGTEGITSSGLVHLRGLPITKLSLRPCEVDEARLTPLLDLPQLRTLTIHSDSLRDDDLAAIGKLTGLRLLTIRCKTVSDRGIAHLTRLPSLKQLHMDCSATDSGLSHLAKLKRLRYLEIHGDFSDRGLQQLGKLKSLMYLSIYTHDEPSPAVLQSLRRKLPRLEGISVRPNSALRTSFSGAKGAVMGAP